MGFFQHSRASNSDVKYPNNLPVYSHVLHVVRVLFEPIDGSHRPYQLDLGDRQNFFSNKYCHWTGNTLS